MESTKKIVLIEDELIVSDTLSYLLRKEGYKVLVAEDGETGLHIISKFDPGIIILDLMLPDISGFQACKKITTFFDIPLLLLTAKCKTTNRIIGEECGADYYVLKPFDCSKLVEKIKEILSNTQDESKFKKRITAHIIKINESIEINKYQRKVYKDNVELHFTQKEFDLILFLAENKGKVFSRDEILENVWECNFNGETRTVDIHIQRIRKKLCDGKHNSIIQTVFGQGYSLVEN